MKLFARSVRRLAWLRLTSTSSRPARALQLVAGFALFAFAIGLLSGGESRWELWTTGLLGLLAYVSYPAERPRQRPRGGAFRPRASCEPRYDAAHHCRQPARTRSAASFPAARLEPASHECIANVSHELRAPLTVMLGYVETVRDLELDASASRDYLDRMETQCRRMQGIMDDMLRLTALETAEPAAEQRVDMAGMLERIFSEAEALSAGRHRILVEVEGDFDLLGMERDIASAFGNLASNAVRYTPAGGRIRLIWRASAAGAEFIVEDNGIGVEKQHLPRLTERFYRVERERTRGTGLGLAIVKQALMRHQATLDIESEPGRGSRFTARFPAQRMAATSQQLSIA
jgi:signal transduction histidine kinase